MATDDRYLAATDFSPASRRALVAARALARRAGASLTIVHVRPTSDLRAAVVEDRGDLLRSPRGSLRSAMTDHYRRRIAALIEPGRGERPVIVSGTPDMALCREARRGYDLLIMGNRGHGAVSSLFLGSTTQRVLARSPIPVVVVPSRRRR
jgi:nucleotide-binding universal stress UspA family protein